MEPLSTTLPANLRRLRESRGWTQAQLAEKADLTRVGYRNIETGKAVPRASTLQALAQALEVNLAALLRPVTLLSQVRFRSLKRLNSREQVLADVGDWLTNFSQLEQLLGDLKTFDLDEKIRRLRASAEPLGPAELAREVRALLGLGEVEPIRDICGLLESAGVKVYRISVASDAFFGLSVGREDGGPAVVVNTWERIAVERWIFTAAHELGHLLLHLDAYNASDSDERPNEEKEADTFAAHFLLPEGAFRKEWAASAGSSFVDRVLKLKRMFRVSYKTVLYRLSETSALGKQVWGRFQAEYTRRFGRSLQKADEPEALGVEAFRAASTRAAEEPDSLSPTDFTEDRLQLLVRHAVERDLISLGRGGEILGLHLREMRALASSWVE
ncbi:MAG: hypothetical protein DIJKHBIC_02312 [Thermoanaerobaculia bacterium]|nr:hypothetical protein [Thermoanaerobaculia bacterium]